MASEMSKRYYETDHAKVYVQWRPVPPPTLINRAIEFLKEKYDGPLSQALDLGCGSGQCTFAVAKHFTSVLGTDLSPAQLSAAGDTPECKNVKFQVAPAEKIPMTDHSAQLITICEAAHWMELAKVYEEARRVLCPNGVLAIIGYPFPPVYGTQREENDAEAKSEAIKKIVDRAVEPLSLNYLPERAWTVFKEYSDITIPFSDFTRESGFTFTRGARLVDIEGCIRTYAPFKTFSLEKGEAVAKEFMDGIKSSITSVLNEGRETQLTPEEAEKYEFTETWKYFMLMARV